MRKVIKSWMNTVVAFLNSPERGCRKAKIHFPAPPLYASLDFIDLYILILLGELLKPLNPERQYKVQNSTIRIPDGFFHYRYVIRGCWFLKEWMGGNPWGFCLEKRERDDPNVWNDWYSRSESEQIGGIIDIESQLCLHYKWVVSCSNYLISDFLSSA